MFAELLPFFEPPNNIIPGDYTCPIFVLVCVGFGILIWAVSS